MTTMYAILADIIAVLHTAVAICMLTLLFFVFKKEVPDRYLQLQGTLIGTALIFHFTTGVCPLTFAEKKLRLLGGVQVYDGSFLNYYAEKFLHFSISTEMNAAAIALLVFLFIFIMVQKRIKVKQKAFV